MPMIASTAAVTLAWSTFSSPGTAAELLAPTEGIKQEPGCAKGRWCDFFKRAVVFSHCGVTKHSKALRNCAD
jgi:hypothetical protein